MPAGAQQQVVSREKLRSPGPNKPPPPPLAGSEVYCFESHSQAPEGLLIPISDNGPQSLIIYSCPPVNNKTKQNKTKQNDRNGWKGGWRKSQNLWGFAPSTPMFDLLMTIAIKIITVYTAVTCLSSLQKFSISRLICFSRRLSFQQRAREKASALFIKLLIAPQAKAAAS